ncbi:STAS domain-containing protein [Actinomadura nitritigenes]|uniref:STAS domain-containing protein n=1 Tax=Actinomadura nitritigenes TaxID=134602 RepID=UPI0033510A0E
MAAAPDDHATFALSWREGWVVLTVAGEIDFVSAPSLTRYLNAAINLHSPPLIAVDLSQLAFCDSSALREFVIAWKRIGLAHGRMVMLNPTCGVAGLLHITGLDRALDIHTALPDHPAWPS